MIASGLATGKLFCNKWFSDEESAMRQGRLGWMLGMLCVLGLMWIVTSMSRRGNDRSSAVKPSPSAMENGEGDPEMEPKPQIPLTESQKAALLAMSKVLGDLGFGSPFQNNRRFVPWYEMPKFRVSGARTGEPDYESSSILQSLRVELLLSVGLQDRKPVGELMQKMLEEALAAWPAAAKVEDARWSSGDIWRDGPKPLPTTPVRVQAETAIYVLGQMRYHEGIKAMYGGYRKQVEWINAAPESEYGSSIGLCPPPTPMTLYAMHRLMETYPEAELGEKSPRALRAYRQWAKSHVPAADRFRVVRGAPDSTAAAETQPAFPVHREEYVHEWPVMFQDGTEMQKYPVAPYLTDESKEWFALMQAFVESLR